LGAYREPICGPRLTRPTQRPYTRTSSTRIKIFSKTLDPKAVPKHSLRGREWSSELGLFASISRASADEPPCVGWLINELRLYRIEPDLKTMIHFSRLQSVGGPCLPEGPFREASAAARRAGLHRAYRPCSWRSTLWMSNLPQRPASWRAVWTVTGNAPDPDQERRIPASRKAPGQLAGAP